MKTRTFCNNMNILIFREQFQKINKSENNHSYLKKMLSFPCSASRSSSLTALHGIVFEGTHDIFLVMPHKIPSPPPPLKSLTFLLTVSFVRKYLPNSGPAGGTKVHRNPNFGISESHTAADAGGDDDHR